MRQRIIPVPLFLSGILSSTGLAAPIFAFGLPDILIARLSEPQTNLNLDFRLVVNPGKSIVSQICKQAHYPF